MNGAGLLLAALAAAFIVGLFVFGLFMLRRIRQRSRPSPSRRSATIEREGSFVSQAAGGASSGEHGTEVKLHTRTDPLVTLPATVSDVGTLSATAGASRGAAHLSAYGTRVTVSHGLTAAQAVVAVFSEPDTRDAQHNLATYQATIWWGDGGEPSTGVVMSGAGGTFGVRGTHTYPQPGIYVLRVEIGDGRGNATTVGSRAHIGSGAERFMAQVGALLLHRPITAEELARWIPETVQATTPLAVVEAMLHSDEYRSAIVEEMYRALLDRVPTSDELDHAIGRLAAGAPVGAVAAHLLGSPEYAAHHGAERADFLAILAAMAFGRELDPQEARNWSFQLEQGTSRESLAVAVLESPEARSYQWRRFRAHLLGRSLPAHRSDSNAGDGVPSIRFQGEQLPSGVGAHEIDASLQQQIWQSLYSAFYPILETDYQNQLVHQWQPPQPVEVSYPYWTYRLVGGQRALLNDPPSFEWVPVLVSSPEQVGHDIDHFVAWFPFGEQEMNQGQLVGISGTAVLDGPLRDGAHPYMGGRDYLVSDHDVPFTHPLGNDVEFFVVPDSSYVPLLGPANTLLGAPLLLDEEYHKAMQKALAPYPTGLGLSDAAVHGVLGVEMDAACLPPDYRPLDGDRVAIFGRWIVDAGHADFHTEIHPPLLVVGARQVTSQATHSWLIGRAFLVSQLFYDHDGNRTRGLRGALEDQLTAQVTSFVLSGRGNSPTPQRLNLRPAVLPGYASAYGTLCVVTMDYVVRPPTPRSHSDDRLLVTYHFTARTGVRVYLLNTGDDGVQVVIDMGRTFYEGMAPPAGAQDTVVHVSDLDNPELQNALDQKRQEIAQDHGDDVGQFFQTIIDLGADTIAYAPATWPQPSSPADTMNVVSGMEVTALPAADSFMLGQTLPAQIALDDQQAFPVYGYVDLVWKRATPLREVKELQPLLP